MGLSSLGKLFFETAKQHGKAFWQDLNKDVQKETPSWDKVRSDINHHGHQFKQDFAYEFQRWLEKELRQNRNLRSLWNDNTEVEAAYRLLGVSYGADMETVKQRWRDLLKETHPDRFMSNPTAYAKATEKTQRLTAAYHCISKAKEEGFV